MEGRPRYILELTQCSMAIVFEICWMMFGGVLELHVNPDLALLICGPKALENWLRSWMRLHASNTLACANNRESYAKIRWVRVEVVGANRIPWIVPSFCTLVSI